MKKKISFVILSSSGAPAKQICTSKSSIFLFGVVLMSLFAAIGYIVYDYYNLKGTASQLQNRDRHISNQMD